MEIRNSVFLPSESVATAKGYRQLISGSYWSNNYLVTHLYVVRCYTVP